MDDMTSPLRLNYLTGLQRALRDGGERAMQRFLDKTHRPLYQCFARGWNTVAVSPQFRFGKEFVADYLVLSASSGAITPVLVEIESPSARLFLKDGSPSMTLRTAQRQLSDWAAWIAARPEQFRREIVELLEQSREAPDTAPLPGYRAAVLIDQLSRELVPLRPEYAIVIGRRAELTDDDQRRRARQQNLDAEIITYDRLIDIGHADARRGRANSI